MILFIRSFKTTRILYFHIVGKYRFDVYYINNNHITYKTFYDIHTYIEICLLAKKDKGVL